MLTVHLRVNDAATGAPTPVRLAITGPDGTFYPPLGRFAEFPVGRNEAVGGHLRLGRDRWCYVNGSCEVPVPAGVPLRVRVVKGPEFEPLDETVTLGAGQMALRFAVRRWSDVRADGWHPGDTRSHFLTPHDALLEAAAEDVAVANLLTCLQHVPSQNGMLYSTAANLAAFSGQEPALRTDAAMVAVGTLNVHPVLGKVGLLHAHRVVHPLTFGGADDTDDWSVCDWCDQCHRKNGLAVWADPFEAGDGEALVALILGKIDAVELTGRPRKVPFLTGWYRLLNAGFAVPVVGGSGKDSNVIPLGSPRTYTKLAAGEPLTYSNWVNAARAGRCFVTNGPLLRFDVEGSEPGGVVDLAGPGPVRVRASAASVAPFERLEVVADGKAVASARATNEGPRYTAAVEVGHAAVESCWLAARCEGGAGSLLDPRQPTFAHTSPAVVWVAGRPLPSRPTAVAALRRSVERTREWVELHGRFAEERRKRAILAHCDAALAALAGGPP